MASSAGFDASSWAAMDGMKLRLQQIIKAITKTCRGAKTELSDSRPHTALGTAQSVIRTTVEFIVVRSRAFVRLRWAILIYRNYSFFRCLKPSTMIAIETHMTFLPERHVLNGNVGRFCHDCSSCCNDCTGLMEKPATNITVAVAVEVFPIPRSGKLFAWGRLCLLGILRGIDEFFVHRSSCQANGIDRTICRRLPVRPPPCC